MYMLFFFRFWYFYRKIKNRRISFEIISNLTIYMYIDNNCANLFQVATSICTKFVGYDQIRRTCFSNS